MPSMKEATRAYESAATHRTQREQEADVFRRATGALRTARDADALQRVRALADNRRLWMTVADLMRDPLNALPLELRAGIVSVGLAVQREIDRDAPDFDFLIAVNENIAAGLAG
jgi:flagellar biosynthesis activator protein FlaF